jgi:LemA protein
MAPGRGKSMTAVWIIIALAVVVVIWVIMTYNRLVGLKTQVANGWSQIDIQLKRRYDLIPNLVESVKDYMGYEQETLRQVVEARSRVGQVSAEAGAEIVNDPDRFRQFQEAQDQLSSALSRLLVVVERYPDIKSTQAFRDLMPALEGTENRINVERRRYNEVAREFNATRRRVPAAWFIGLLNWDFAEKTYFEAQEGAEQAPRVEF